MTEFLVAVVSTGESPDRPVGNCCVSSFEIERPIAFGGLVDAASQRAWDRP